ncbi:hypothetical protein PP187_gp219 [Klebsiella phage vB_KvM-Eowyn]|uniref:Uncharacterized protein n=1 Tax=Klebsiella phage vB_KvM-Eowyn TaxID=2762819 RepID=A0A7R8R9N6_9CAUD|nr:hypothetical protein PP187_gp219 [Klebsiella phage vB_KvM-Eowyn]CAD5236208.1 hypothetical protein LLCLJKAH_00219 [Klebsiella phage vB_KvM-Eowyn]
MTDVSDLTVVQNLVIEALGKLPGMVYKLIETYKPEELAKVTAQLEGQLPLAALGDVLQSYLQKELGEDYAAWVRCIAEEGVVDVVLMSPGDEVATMPLTILDEKLVRGWCVGLLHSEGES